MAEVKKVGDIQVDQDLDFQEKEWKVERIGWIIGLILLIIALAGMFGPGPLSSQTAQNGPLEVQYLRFVRYRAPVTITIQVQPQQVQDGKTSVWIDRKFLDQYDVNKIVPEPDAAHLMPDRIVYDFQVEQPNEPLLISLELEANHFGSARGRLGETGTEQVVNFNQFVYP